MSEEYIKKSDILNKCYCKDDDCTSYCPNVMCCGSFGLSYFEIEQIKPADVQPVVHAKWFAITEPDEKGRVEYCCDHCRKFISGTWNKDQKYCGACGARMDL